MDDRGALARDAIVGVDHAGDVGNGRHGRGAHRQPEAALCAYQPANGAGGGRREPWSYEMQYGGQVTGARAGLFHQLWC